MKPCERCYDKAFELLPLEWDNDCGEHETLSVCGECLTEVANGAPVDEWYPDIYHRRLGQLYVDDPVNNSHLWRYSM